MLLNYIKIAIRSLWKHKLFSLIHVFGLGLAMAFCFMQLIQIQSSFEKDTFHPYPSRTYRILTDATDEDGKRYALASTPFPLGDKLMQEQSGIEKSVRVIRNFGGSMSNGIKSLRVDGIYADPSYFDVFGFKLEKGTPAVEPRTVVLTHETAERFYGNADPIGKILIHPELGAFQVTGVFEALKNFQTHLKSDLVVSMASYPANPKNEETHNWLDYNTYTFVLLPENTGPEALDRALAAVARDNAKHVAFTNIKSHTFRSQKLGAISPDYENLLNNPYVEPIWKIGVSLLFPLIIMLLAGFNYVNLTLTRSLSRGREVGVRKVAGAKRSQLVVQFLTETLVIAMLALVVGYVFLQVMKGYIHVSWLVWEVHDSRLLWLIFTGFALLAGFLAGILPARILSSFQPVQILKGALGPVGVGKAGFRKTLTVIQFVVALVFMTGTGIMNSQFDYMATDNQNFNRKNILNIPLPAGNDVKLLTGEMSKLAGVNRIGAASAPFNEAAGKATLSAGPTNLHPAYTKDAYLYAVDANFIRNMRLSFVAGTNIPVSTDTLVRFVVLNEKAARSLGFENPKDVIGKTILLNDAAVLVSGVVKDFCIMRYELPVSPLVLAFNPKDIKILSLEIAEATDKEKLTASLNRIWKRYHPHESFVYSWYEQQLYDEYMQGGDKSVTALMVLIVFVIAAMGLFGMVTYTAEKRIKEVGVRKVMGASVPQIMRLLSGSFLKLMLIAALIALPVGYLLGALFLGIFTYHAPLGPGVFLMCAGSLSLIGLLTIGLQTYRTAITNPAETLRAD